MAKLTKNQKEILKNFNISIEDAFDASGMSKHQYGEEMKENGYQIAYGVSHCIKGHGADTLKWRTGRCAQCYPHHKIFIDRHDEYGYVYYAYPEKAKLTKLGSCKNMTNRRKTLNSNKTGSFNDWIMPTALYCDENAGLIEHLVKKEFSKYKVIDNSFRDINDQVSTEIFNIEPELAWRTILKIGKENGYEP